MKSLYSDKDALNYKSDLDLRVYTSRLLGEDSSLVLHGGGNTSVKSTVKDLFGNDEEILYVKGSGWDLSTIKAEGFAPVKMDMLLKMAQLQELSDIDMVKYQRVAMIDSSAPNPSVEAILHAIIPFKFVDHTHADAVITITNTLNAKERIEEIYKKRVLIIPYIMPGFVLAKLVYDMTKDVDWQKLDGLVLMNHGLFTFSDSAKISYEKTIDLVNKAEKYLQTKNAILDIQKGSSKIDLLTLAKIRKEVSTLKEKAIISCLNESDLALHFSKENIEKIATQGPLTPDHVIRTKRIPVILGDNFSSDLIEYTKAYKSYFNDHKTTQTLLNPAPNFAILKENGSLSFGSSVKEANIIKDINEHTYEAILKAELLGGYKALSPAEIFEVGYWSLEQAKLKSGSKGSEFGGKVAVITDGSTTLGASIAKILNERGAAVVVGDAELFNEPDSDKKIQKFVEQIIKSFGGVDIVIYNSVNDKKLVKYIEPFLELGVDPTAVVVNSKDFNLKDLKASGVRVHTIKSSSKEDLAEVIVAVVGEPFAKIVTTEVII